MISIERPEDINWINLYWIVYQREPVELGDALLAQVDAGQQRFNALIERGIPCYGVTTSFGKLVEIEPGHEAEREIIRNTLRERASAFGEPLPRPAARAMLVLRLVNFLTGRDGVSSNLCRFLVGRLNDDFVPWVPILGHGMAADASANSHAFQILVGQGHVMTRKGKRKSAAKALRKREIEPFTVNRREALALVNGIAAAPALAFDAWQVLDGLYRFANLVAAISIDGIAAPRDAIDPAVASVSNAAGVGRVIDALRKHLNHSQIQPFKLQAPVSYRVVPQVHGAFADAMARFKQEIENCFTDFSDNPMLEEERFLSVGLFHNQHLVNQAEQVALALAHIGCLSERRLHRLLDPAMSGLNAQLAQQPGIDVGLVTTQKACIDLAARLRLQAQPVSLYTSETSAGQEDYMSLAIPTLARLYEMTELCRAMLAYEMLAGITAIRLRGQIPGDDVAEVDRLMAESLPQTQDLSPGQLVEQMLENLKQGWLAGVLQ